MTHIILATNRMEIHPCNFEDRQCDTYGCQNRKGYRKYFLGRPDAAVHKPTFCEVCVRHMLSTVPMELSGIEANLQDQMRAGIIAEYEEKFKIYQLETAARYQAQYLEILAATQPVEEVQVEQVMETIVAEETLITPPLYRCLDCGDDFDTPQGLSNHKRAKHKEG